MQAKTARTYEKMKPTCPGSTKETKRYVYK